MLLRHASQALLTLALAVNLLACASSQEPPTTPAPEPVEAESAPPTPEQLWARAFQLVEIAGEHSSYGIDDDDAARVVEAGATEEELITLVETLFEPCLSRNERCDELHPLHRDREDESLRAVQILAALLGEIGTVGSLPLLVRLDARGLYEADRAIIRQLERLAAEARPDSRCAPPTADELARARAGLDGFLVLRLHEGLLCGEAPTPAELDDLAYFLAAVGDALPAVGTTREAGAGNWGNAGPPDAEITATLERHDAMQLTGDLEDIAASARAYLTHLGYPDPIRTERASQYTWGGARYSYVMRDLARATEALGQVEEAARLYRRANPGGGACGTSVSSRWAAQVRGVIRASERAGRCREVIVERLIAVDGNDSEAYGPAPLEAAGYDVERLYRGALVTRDRDIEEYELRAALERAPETLRAAALARLERVGPEAWEGRVFALEGLADRAQLRSIDRLLELAGTGSAELAARALEAIGRLTWRPEHDPCDPERGGFGLRGISSSWSREVRSIIGNHCETMLREADAEALARRITPFLRHEDPSVRTAAAQTLGDIGSPAAVDALRTLLDDNYQPSGYRVCTIDDSGAPVCRQPFPVREAAEQAIERIGDVVWLEVEPDTD